MEKLLVAKVIDTHSIYPWPISEFICSCSGLSPCARTSLHLQHLCLSAWGFSAVLRDLHSQRASSKVSGIWCSQGQHSTGEGQALVRNTAASTSLHGTTLRCVRLTSSMRPQQDRAPVAHSSNSLINIPTIGFSLFSASLFPLSDMCFLRSPCRYIPGSQDLSQGLFLVEAKLRLNFPLVWAPSWSPYMASCRWHL